MVTPPSGTQAPPYQGAENGPQPSVVVPASRPGFRQPRFSRIAPEALPQAEPGRSPEPAGPEAYDREYRREIRWRVIRRTVGILSLLTGLVPVLLWWSGLVNGIEVRTIMIVVFPFLAIGGLLLSVDVVDYASGMIEQILWPRHYAKPEPIYGKAQSLVAKGRYVEAEQEYEKIIQEFPDEVKPHIDLIGIAVRRMNDGELAEKLFQRGMGILKDPGRGILSKSYADIRSLLRKEEKLGDRNISSAAVEKAQSHFAIIRRSLWR